MIDNHPKIECFWDKIRRTHLRKQTSSFGRNSDRDIQNFRNCNVKGFETWDIRKAPNRASLEPSYLLEMCDHRAAEFIFSKMFDYRVFKLYSCSEP